MRTAFEAASEAQDAFEKAVLAEGRRVLGSITPEDFVVLVTGRPYNLHDERLNLKLGHQLAKTGIKGIPMDFLDTDAEDLSDFPDMYWGLGAKILRTARVVARTPDWFGLHLTNFSCGADSFIEHFYKYLMGDKPCLILELDEHSAVAGMMTRIEAFKNVMSNVLCRTEPTEDRSAAGGSRIAG